MGSDWEVKVLWGAWSQEPLVNRKVPSREDGTEGSGKQNRGSTNRNRITGDVDQGERANDCKALVTKGKRRRSGDRAGKATALTRGGLASRLKGRRRKAEREVSRGRSSRRRTGARRTERQEGRNGHEPRTRTASDVQTTGAPARGYG